MHSTTTFLLAEDNPDETFFVEQGFKHGLNHLQLRSVSDGAQAIEYMEGKGDYADRIKYPVPDVVLLDLKMPRVDGFEFLHWLRNNAPDALRLTPVVILSSSAEIADVTRAYKMGANSYFMKPVGLRDFQARISELGAYWSKNLRQRRMAAA